jgi:hypothetical protein
MGSFDQTFANSVLDAAFDRAGASVRLSTGPMHCRYMTANGTATSNGTELGTASGYTAGAGAPTFTTAAAAAGTEASNSAITTTNMPATTIVGVEVWDQAGTPLRKQWGALSANKTTNLGDTFTIPSGSLTSALP